MTLGIWTAVAFTVALLVHVVGASHGVEFTPTPSYSSTSDPRPTHTTGSGEMFAIIPDTAAKVLEKDDTGFHDSILFPTDAGVVKADPGNLGFANANTPATLSITSDHPLFNLSPFPDAVRASCDLSSSYMTIQTVSSLPSTTSASNELASLLATSQVEPRTLVLLDQLSLTDACKNSIPNEYIGKDGSIMLLIEGRGRKIEGGRGVEAFVRLDVDAAQTFISDLTIEASSMVGTPEVGRRGLECTLKDVECRLNAGWNTGVNYNETTNAAQDPNLTIIRQGPIEAGCTNCYSKAHFDVSMSVGVKFNRDLSQAFRRPFLLKEGSYVTVSAGSMMNLDFEAGVDKVEFVSERVELFKYSPPGGIYTKNLKIGPSLVLDAYADATSTLVQKYTAGVDVQIPPFTLTHQLNQAQPNTSTLLHLAQGIQFNHHKPRKTPTSNPDGEDIRMSLGVHLVPKIVVEFEANVGTRSLGGGAELYFDLRGGLEVMLVGGLAGLGLKGVEEKDNCRVPFALNVNATLGFDFKIEGLTDNKFKIWDLPTRNITTGCIDPRTGSSMTEPEIKALEASASAAAALATTTAGFSSPTSTALATQSSLATARQQT
ncbi:hypothetical protein HDU67_002850 [Dinochytrium kinnereticum]|nr:hypothetical protein HDU67_002850 [Dinochytrium kinnereticum]